MVEHKVPLQANFPPFLQRKYLTDWGFRSSVNRITFDEEINYLDSLEFLLYGVLEEKERLEQELRKVTGAKEPRNIYKELLKIKDRGLL